MRLGLLIISISLMVGPADAFAYIGVGAGLSAIGSLLALVAAVLLTIIGFIWYPIKRMLRWRKTMHKEKKEETPP